MENRYRWCNWGFDPFPYKAESEPYPNHAEREEAQYAFPRIPQAYYDKRNPMIYSRALQLLNTKKRYRNLYRLGRSSRLIRHDDETIIYQFYTSPITTLHSDGTYTLDLCGWPTVGTKMHINKVVPFRVWSERGRYYFGPAIGETKSRIQKCRACRGRLYDSSRNRILSGLRGEKHFYRCWRCNSQDDNLPPGYVEYGLKPIYREWDGHAVRVDRDGRRV